MACKGALLGDQSRSEEQLELDYYSDFYHGDGKCWSAEKVPLVTLIWMRKIKTNLFPFKRWPVILARICITIVYFCSRLGASVWILIMNGYINEIMEFPKEISKKSGKNLANNLCVQIVHFIGCFGILIVVLLTIMKDVQKGFWWFCATKYSYSGKKIRMDSKMKKTVYLDFLIIVVSSLTNLMLILAMFVYAFEGENNATLLFQLTTLPGLLFWQEIDERLGNFLKSGGRIFSDPNDFKYTDKSKKKMNRLMFNCQAMCCLIGFLSVIWFVVNPFNL